MPPRLLDPDQVAGDLVSRRDKVHGPGRDRSGRHVRIHRSIAIGALRDGEPAAFLDRLEAKRAIASGAGQHDADCTVPQSVRKRVEQAIDGSVVARRARFRHADSERATLEAGHGMGRRNIDAVRLHGIAVHRLEHRHGSPAPEYLGQHALPVLWQVQNHDEG